MFGTLTRSFLIALLTLLTTLGNASAQSLTVPLKTTRSRTLVKPDGSSTAIVPLLTQSASKATAKAIFTLRESGKTSAGIFRSSDSTLVRTLWGNEQLSAGTHTLEWDGKLDDLTTSAPDVGYYAQVLFNNVKYQLLGVIGNNSEQYNTTGSHTHMEGFFLDMVIAGNYAYCANGYDEGNSSKTKFALSRPRVNINVMAKGIDVKSVAVDEQNVYWAGVDPNQGRKSFVVVTRRSDDAQVTFSGGKSYKTVHGETYNSIIADDMSGTAVSDIRGIAVTNKYIYTAFYDRNRINVTSKLTGLPLFSFAMPAPGKIKSDGNSTLWAITDGTVKKFSINPDGTLTGPTLTLSGLTEPVAIGLASDNRIAVNDAGINQNVRYYNRATGAYLDDFGSKGGYATSSDVFDNKFIFKNPKRFTGKNVVIWSFYAEQPDGSFWVGDQGNTRSQHFASNRKYIDNIDFTGFHYSFRIDQNDSSRAFANYEEFAIDYSKTPSNDNSTGWWKPKRNWLWNVVAAKDNQYFRLLNVVTLSNGRTYALARVRNTLEVIELVNRGNIRYTGITFPNLTYSLRADGSLWNNTGTSAINQPISWRRQPLMGFDGNDNPTWGKMVTMATLPTVTGTDPVASEPVARSYGQLGNNVVSFANNKSNGTRGYGYHLGLIPFGASTWKWQTMPSTNPYYRGPYPTNHFFDIGNKVNNAGGFVQVVGRHIFWNYFGEFWKGSQTNKYTHVYENGLMVGQFGAAMDKQQLAYYNPPDQAGNAQVGAFTSVGGVLYLGHNDEGVRGGSPFRKITGLNTIKIQTIPIKGLSIAKAAPAYISLFAGLPYASLVQDNTAGFRREPAENYENDTKANVWATRTNVYLFDPSVRDVEFVLYPKTGGTPLGTSTFPVTNDLVKTNWRIIGKLTYVEGSEPDDTNNDNQIQGLDNMGKVLWRIRRGPNLTFNGKTLLTAVNTFPSYFTISTPGNFSISCSTSTCSMTYNGVTVKAPYIDPTANRNRPATIEVLLRSTTRNGHRVSIGDPRFYYQ
ncbi:hypothetical protein [Spirosoma sp.]|uniref:hypothetical protein n=1 Tax=Spirosoma sp. TaxID=1899569 RepID=UPI003B3ABAD5